MSRKQELIGAVAIAAIFILGFAFAIALVLGGCDRPTAKPLVPHPVERLALRDDGPVLVNWPKFDLSPIHIDWSTCKVLKNHDLVCMQVRK